MTEDDGFYTIHPPMDGRSPSGRATAAEPVVSALRDGIPNAWQPIETAPKDGTPILIYHRLYWDDWPAEILPEMMARKHGDGGYERLSRLSVASWESEFPEWLICNIEYCELNGTPTHWMPLPPPPAQGMEAEGGDSEAGSVYDSPTPQGDAPDTSHNQEAG